MGINFGIRTWDLDLRALNGYGWETLQEANLVLARFTVISYAD